MKSPHTRRANEAVYCCTNQNESNQSCLSRLAYIANTSNRIHLPRPLLMLMVQELDMILSRTLMKDFKRALH